MAQAVAPRLRPGAKLVNISSGMGSMELNIGAGGPLDAYALTKAALNLLTRQLAEELRAANITVVAINPGWVRTAMGGPDAPTEVDTAVEQIVRTIRELRPEQSGHFLSAMGGMIPWSGKRCGICPSVPAWPLAETDRASSRKVGQVTDCGHATLEAFPCRLVICCQGLAPTAGLFKQGWVCFHHLHVVGSEAMASSSADLSGPTYWQ